MFECTVGEGVATLTMARPPVNAISNDWIDAFHRSLDRLESQRDWQVLRIQSALRVFCAGADLAQIRARFALADGPDQIRADTARFHTLFDRIERLDRITLAVIGGTALGGGLELALACDLRLAADSASLGLPEARLGLLPGAGGTQRLTRLCGRGTAARLILTGEIVDGATAARLGIVQWAVAEATLAERSDAIAAAIGQLAPAALAASKACIAAAGDPTRDGFREELDATRDLFSSPDTRARVTAFLDARKK